MRLLLIFCMFLFSFSTTIGQGITDKKSTFDLAHDLKIADDEFVDTDSDFFKAKVYAVSKSLVNRTHHWFFKLVDNQGNVVNFANIEVEGYHKNDPSQKFNFMEPVFKLCSEGKYIVGYVKVKQAGTWVLDFKIDDSGVEDTITFEIEIEKG